MSPRTKRLGIILLVCLLLCLTYFVISGIIKNDSSENENSQPYTLLELNVDDITNFSYSTNGIYLSFSSINGQWFYDGDQSFPLTQNIIDEMVATLSQVSAERKLDEYESLDTYGLQDPSVTIVAKTNNNHYTIYIGDYNSYASQYYVKYNDEVYLSDGAFTTSFDKNLFDYLTTTELESFSQSKIVSFVIDGIEYSDESQIESLFKVYTSMSRGEVVDYGGKENYGFDGSEHRVIIKYNSSTDVTDTNGNTTSTITSTIEYTFSFANVDENSYIMLQDDSLIYSVDGANDFIVIE